MVVCINACSHLLKSKLHYLHVNVKIDTTCNRLWVEYHVNKYLHYGITVRGTSIFDVITWTTKQIVNIFPSAIAQVPINNNSLQQHFANSFSIDSSPYGTYES